MAGEESMNGSQDAEAARRLFSGVGQETFAADIEIIDDMDKESPNTLDAFFKRTQEVAAVDENVTVIPR